MPPRQRKGEYLKKFLPGHRCNPTGPESPNWKGGRTVTVNGYVQVYAPGHHTADKNGYVLEHRLVYEKTHDVTLTRHQVVHHVNHVKTDNRPENLMLIDSQAQHQSLHRRAQEAAKQAP